MYKREMGRFYNYNLQASKKKKNEATAREIYFNRK